MRLKRLLQTLFNLQNTSHTTAIDVPSCNQYDVPQTLYERIAYGNALEEAEVYARSKWQR